MTTALTLRVSDNRRHFVGGDGLPFFYLGDTAWELFHRLTRAETEAYLQDRAAKGFTAIHACLLAEHGFETPNAEGHLPLHGLDPARPNGAYFEAVDWAVRRANALGLIVGLLPTWGDKWNRATGAGPEIFTPDNARGYGRFLGERYRADGVVWILGGDRAVETERHRAVIRAMAAGLADGDGGAHLRTFHPPGPRSSSDYFPDEPWLDFHQWQSGHRRNMANYALIAQDYARTPTKPVLDGEPVYEDHPANFDWTGDNPTPQYGYFDDYDVRKAGYWAVLAGACGHVYGCHDVWQFLDPARFPPVTTPRTPWREALDLPGAGQMRHLRALWESRPAHARVPDPSLLRSPPDGDGEHMQAIRAEDGSHAFVYLPTSWPVTVRAERLAGNALDAHWYDPRTGAWADIGRRPKAEALCFVPPTPGLWRDWVLVLDAV